MNRGFSLVELMIAIVIITVLSLIGVRTYNAQKERGHIAWTKSEMGDVLRMAKMAKHQDGYYHQFIYTMGYRPQGKLFATVGTAASQTAVCCDSYPALTDDPCVKNGQSGFTYYRCKNTSPHNLTDNVEICDSTDYSRACEKDAGNGTDLPALTSAHFADTCTPDPAAWCDCNNFTVGARTFSGKLLTLNQTDTFCAGE